MNSFCTGYRVGVGEELTLRKAGCTEGDWKLRNDVTAELSSPPVYEVHAGISCVASLRK